MSDCGGTSWRWKGMAASAALLSLALSVAAPAGAGGRLRNPAVQQPAKPAEFDFDIPPQILSSGIASYMNITGVKVEYTPELVQGKRTNGVFNSYNAEDGLAVLLDGTGLVAKFADPKTAVLGRE